jgi:hypothetical protein
MKRHEESGERGVSRDVPGARRRKRHVGDADKDRERVEWMPDTLPRVEATLAVKVDLIERHRPGLNDQGCE